MLLEIRKCITPEEIISTFTVMNQLRQTIHQEEYVNLITSLMSAENYTLVGAYNTEGLCVGVAGFRFRRSLFRDGNRELYVDDLVSDETSRSLGVGHQIMEWLKEESRRENCVGIVLDSGLKRTDAHRFYTREGMEATALHFYRPRSPDTQEKGEKILSAKK